MIQGPTGRNNRPRLRQDSGSWLAGVIITPPVGGCPPTGGIRGGLYNIRGMRLLYIRSRLLIEPGSTTLLINIELNYWGL